MTVPPHRWPWLAIAVVACHYVVNFAHGAVHGLIPVALSTGQTAFVVLVVTAGPIVALVLLRRGRSEVGWATLAAVLAASLLFSVVFHYVVPSPDHVAHVPNGPWKLPFGVTAGAVTVVDAGGALLAARYAAYAHSDGQTASIDSTT